MGGRFPCFFTPLFVLWYTSPALRHYPSEMINEGGRRHSFLIVKAEIPFRIHFPELWTNRLAATMDAARDFGVPIEDVATC